MSIHKHTPGPWKWVRGYMEDFDLIGKDGTKVADDGSAGGEYSGWMDSPDNPNARLIAAAPDLLEALQGLMSISSYMDQNESPSEYAAARAAIAKATGAQS